MDGGVHPDKPEIDYIGCKKRSLRASSRHEGGLPSPHRAWIDCEEVGDFLARVTRIDDAIDCQNSPMFQLRRTARAPHGSYSCKVRAGGNCLPDDR